jgi:hypothetical protein
VSRPADLVHLRGGADALQPHVRAWWGETRPAGVELGALYLQVAEALFERSGAANRADRFAHL